MTDIDSEIRAALPDGWCYGYIGNIERWGDDRGWRLWPPARRRPYSHFGVSIGDYSTDNRHKLLALLTSGEAQRIYQDKINKGEWHER